MDTPPEVELVLPCLDEATGLAWLLPRVPPEIAVILADNGSTDGSAQIARDHAARVIDVPQRGYGAACQAGLLAARADIVVVMDADGSLDPAQLGRVLDPVREGRLDLAIGARRPVQRGAQPWHLRVANRALAARLAARTGVRLHDLGPVRAARRTALLGLDLQDRRSGYPAETVVKAADAGWRIGEVSVDYRVRSGRSKVTGTPRGIVQAVRDMSVALTRPVG
jgi:glycosyltransferase involved in cell wall biosynthesis